MLCHKMLSNCCRVQSRNSAMLDCPFLTAFFLFLASFFEILISGLDLGDAFRRTLGIFFHTMNVVEPMLGFIFVCMINP